VLAVVSISIVAAANRSDVLSGVLIPQGRRDGVSRLH